MEQGLDLYAESDENFENFGQDQMTDGVNQDNQVDGLYDDVIGGDPPMGSHKAGENGDHMGDNDDSFHHGSGGSAGAGGGRRYTIIVGNLTWWTSEQDLQELIDGYGVHDLYEIRIHENRANGQSKGFAMITVGSEDTSKFLQSEIPKKDLQGQNPVCVPFSRQALNTFDAQARKNESGGRGMGQGMDQRRDGGGMMDRDRDRRMGMGGGNDGRPGGPMMGGPMGGPMGNNPMNPNNPMGNMNTQNRPPGMRLPPGFPPRMGMPGMPGMPRFPMPLPGGGMMPGMPRFPMGMPRNPMMMMPRPDGSMMGGMGDSMMGGMGAAFGFPNAMARMQMAANVGLPAPHVNPAFFAGQMGGAIPGQEFGGNGDMGALGGGVEDFESLVQQMKQVGASAMTKAATECKTDPAGAVHKLESALAVIRASKVADDDRIQRTLNSLQEAIKDVDHAKPSDIRNGDRRDSRERSRERDRGGDRDRDRRDRDDRDRDDRDSRRDRDRRRSRSRSPRDRKRSLEPDRGGRDRDRERERDRDRRSDRDRERGDRRDSDRERDRHR